MKNQWFYKVSSALLIVMLAVTALSVTPAYAALAVRHGLQTGVAPAVACGGNTATAGVVAQLGAAGNCAANNGASVRPFVNNTTTTIVTFYYPTAYASATTITGQAAGSNLYVRDRTGGGAALNTFIDLLECTNATCTTFNVLSTQTYTGVPAAGATAYITNISGLSGIVGAGNRLGIRVRMQTFSNKQVDVRFGANNNAVNTEDAFFNIDETAVVTYALTYNGNTNTGGTAPVDASSPHASGSTVTALGNTGALAKTGYTFTGWNTLAAGTGTHYNTGATFAMPAAATILYADWTGTVTYNGNANTSGTAPTDATAYHPAVTVTALGNTGALARTGFTFAGWNTQANGLGTNYAVGSTFPFAGNITLYAKWNVATTYALTYNGNTNTGGAAPVDASSPYASGATVTALGNTGALAKTGYTFTGWNTLAAGTGTHYNTGATFAMPAAATILYADWTGTVTYNGNANTSGTAPTDATAYHPAATVTALGNTGALARTGFAFAGWNTQANGLGTNYAVGSTFPFAGNITLYAKWNVATTYALTYNGNTNTGGAAPVDASSPYASGATVAALGNTGALAKTGYTFTGWNTLAAGTGTHYNTGATFAMPAAATILYADWTGTVTYNGNANTSGTAPTDATAYHPAVTVTALGNTGALARTGFTFAGWNTQANGLGTNYAVGSTFPFAGNTTLYAKWNINTYTLNYAAGANGSLTGVTSQVVNYGANGTAVTAVPNTNYHFVNWSDGVLTATRTDTNVTANVNVTANFVINPTPTASITNSPSIYNGSVQTATVACLGGGAATLASGGSGTNAGSYPATVDCAASAGYIAANGLPAGNFVISQATQSITVTTNAPANAPNGSTFNVAATASSGDFVSITAAGVCTVVDNGDGTAAITITSGTGTCGVSYTQAGNLNYSAATPVLENVTAQEGPAFISLNSTSFDMGFPGTFTVTATGNPNTMTIVSAGALPTGVTLTDNGDGTALLAGTPAAGTNGTYSLVFTANNGVSPNGIQNFTLTVKNGPVVGANGINSAPDTGDGKVSENESIIDTLGITKLTVEFSQDVYDDPTDALDYGHDATNPANYILVRSATGIFATIDCAGGVVAPDINISVDSVSYSNGGGTGPFVSTLSINGGLPLNVVGFYRLYVCGTTSIVDANNRGLELAGNGTTPGTDYLRNFRIATAVVSGGNGNASSSSKKTVVTNGFLIPVTGFAPNQITNLPAQPADKVYTSMGQMTIEIPTLGVKFPIVGASIANKTWDLTWLKDSVAYLEGSAYPTTAGNTVLTAHVQDANKNLGPFSDIKGMELGQKIYIHVNGQIYVYQVQENSKISSNNIEAMFKHEEDSWITLVTCEDYNAKTGMYSNRRMVRAVLISVIFEK